MTVSPESSPWHHDSRKGSNVKISPIHSDVCVVIDRIEVVENRVNDLATFRWIATGIGTAAVIILGSAQFFGNLLTAGNHGATMGGGTPAQIK